MYLKPHLWAFIPGPISDPPEDTLRLHDISEHSPESIAETFLAFPGMRLVHPPEPTWWEWKAWWEDEDRFIEVDMSLFDVEPYYWGGSSIEASCDVEEVIALWEFVRERHPGVWLTEECEIHTPESFRELFKEECLETAA